MWSVPLRVSCPGPVLRLACLGGGGPVPVPPYLAWGCGGGGWASPGGCLRPSRGAWGVPLPSSARPLGGLSGSALRACGCGGPALFLRGGREVSSWCPGAGPPDSHDEPDAWGGWGDRGWSGAPKSRQSSPTAGLLLAQGEGVAGAFVL